jgi:hypothetical protein
MCIEHVEQHGVINLLTAPTRLPLRCGLANVVRCVGTGKEVRRLCLRGLLGLRRLHLWATRLQAIMLLL